MSLKEADDKLRVGNIIIYRYNSVGNSSDEIRLGKKHPNEVGKNIYPPSIVGT